MTIPDHYMQNGHSKKGFLMILSNQNMPQNHQIEVSANLKTRLSHRQQFGCGKGDVNYNGLRQTFLFYLD